MGAVSEGGEVYLSRDIVDYAGLSEEELAQACERKLREVEERVRIFRGGRPAPALRDRTVIIVDDGIATGGTTRAAIRAVRAQQPSKVILAVPVASPDVVQALSQEVDRVVCLLTPEDLYAIGMWYDDFTQVSDEAVVALLQRARREQSDTEHVVA